MRHSAPAREAMPQKPHGCQPRELNSFQKVGSIVLKLRHKKILRTRRKILVESAKRRVMCAISQTKIRKNGNFIDILVC
jgi:hypothetical protein